MGRKSTTLLGIILVSAMVFPFSIKAIHSSPAQVIPPIVSTDWLYNNLTLTDLVVLDVRSPDAYNTGHIPGAINVPEGMWYTNPPFASDPPWMEIPPKEDLFDLIGNASITRYSWVVVVGATSGLLLPEAPLALYNTAGITRVAIALLYAGVANFTILDGGYEKWVADGYPTETTPNTPTPITYTGTVKSGMVVSKQYVASKIGESIIVDARDAEVYLGFIQEPWAQKVGHIPTAKNLPTPWLWSLTMLNETHVNYGTYKSNETLKELANDIVGTNMTKEIIVYCGVGGYASTMFFVLKEVLGYTNVKMYDGSAQEWTSYPELPVVYEDLGSQYLQLSANYTQLLGDYNDLQSDYEDLTSDYEDLKKATTPAYLTYTFILTTVIFVLIAMYSALKARTKKG